MWGKKELKKSSKKSGMKKLSDNELEINMTQEQTI